MQERTIFAVQYWDNREKWGVEIPQGYLGSYREFYNKKSKAKSVAIKKAKQREKSGDLVKLIIQTKDGTKRDTRKYGKKKGALAD